MIVHQLLFRSYIIMYRLFTLAKSYAEIAILTWVHRLTVARSLLFFFVVHWGGLLTRALTVKRTYTKTGI